MCFIFPFGSEDGMQELIVLVPDLCLSSFYFFCSEISELIFLENVCLFYLSFNLDIYVSVISHSLARNFFTQTKQLSM